MNKAVFLDRDGTINIEKHYLYKIEDFEFIPGVIEGLKLLQTTGFLLVVITNQSGIGRGYYQEEDFLKLNTWMKDELEQKGITISNVYYCPHLADAPIEKYRKVCYCRKPELGLYKQAIKELNIDVSKSYVIGDKIRDCSICNSSDCKGFLIANNEKADILKQVKAGQYKNVKYAVDLLSAAKIIVKENEK